MFDEDSSGISGYGNKTFSFSPGVGHIIDNTRFNYYISVHCDQWDPHGSLKMKGAVITYFLDEAL